MSVLVPVVGGPWDGRVVASPEWATRLKVLNDKGRHVRYRRLLTCWMATGISQSTPRGFVVFT